MINKIYTVNESEEQYLKAKDSIGIFILKSHHFILLSGEDTLSVLNTCSVRKIDDKIFSNIYTFFYKGKNTINEVLILRLSLYRFLVITNKFKPIYKLIKQKARRKQCLVCNVSSDYSLFSFHGKNSNAFFSTLDYKYVYKTKHQNYCYYQLLCPKREETITYNHFTELNFIPMGNDAYNKFLYNNNVILSLDKISKRYRLSVSSQIYPFDNLNIKTKKIRIIKYELESNQLVTNKHRIYSYTKKKAGLIHCIYQLPDYKYPFIIAFIQEPKVNKVSMIKMGKNNAFIRPVVFY